MQEAASAGPSESPASLAAASSSKHASQTVQGADPGVRSAGSPTDNLTSDQPYGPVRSTSETFRPNSLEALTGRASHGKSTNVSHQRGRSRSGLRRRSLASHLPANLDFLDMMEKNDQKAPAVRVPRKLGTLSGVFVPTTLNVLSILMFLRFGFLLGQSGVLGMMAMLISAYLIDMVTAMSISAIATNGTVRGGGAYYLISRSLGPEFGGSIGIVLYLGFVLNTGMNAVGLVDCLTQNFGSISGIWGHFMLEGFWWQYLWGSIVLFLCMGICVAGSSMFAKAGRGLLIILLIATFSIPVTALVQKPFINERLGIEYTGLNWGTFIGNLKPALTKGAAGSQIPGKESFQDLFGILFPATSGIFAGSSMSGDLKTPSKSIPKGTLSGLGTTFVLYTLVILSMAATITRQSLYNNVNIIQDTSIFGLLIVCGEFATSFFSSLMGLIGAAKLLEAVSKDNIVPGLSIFNQGTEKSGREPVNAIIFTFLMAQITMLFDINQIASFVTMTYLMTFLVTNLACFLLKIGSAPNFRPSFHYFSSWTAFAGTIFSGGSMFFVDGVYASGCVCILVLLFLLIHYTTPPKSWGDVSQSLIYHQVRKYLLRLKPEHVKFWRPQILLFVNDFETQYKMIHFCNSLKKGALFVLGRVIVSQDFANVVPDVRKEQASWTKFIEFSKIKAFINIAVAPTAEWGVRNVVLNSGLGGMRPNIVVLGQYRKDHVDSITMELHRIPVKRDVSRSIQQAGEAIANTPRESDSGVPGESPMGVQSYLTILEDLLFKLRINVAVARGFENLEIPSPRGRNTKTCIDLWPIQMSAEISADGLRRNQHVLTTNFDTYTLILQLGCILHTVPSWKSSYKLRVAVFVEYETDVDQERGRVETLLEKLRIEAEILVFWLASGDLQSYRIIVNGEQENIDEYDVKHVDEVLRDEDWWQEMKSFRHNTVKLKNKGTSGTRLQGNGSSSSLQGQKKNSKRIDRLRKIMESSKRRRSFHGIGPGSVNFGMQTQRLLDSMVDYPPESDSTDESSGEDSDIEPYVSDTEDEERSVSSPIYDEATGSGGGREDATRPGTGTQTVSESAVIDDVGSHVGSSPSRPPSTKTAGTEAADKQSLTPPTQETPRIPQVASRTRFTSFPIPEPRVAAEEGTGPSIMFAESPPRSGFSGTRESIYRRTAAAPLDSSADTPSGGNPASGFPGQASVPLSFNDLPCRAQHLILNELIRKHSEKTAVVFTTLPSPIEGTWRDKDASESFVSDLEVLCNGLPPCLLVHSNSMTVTMNL